MPNQSSRFRSLSVAPQAGGRPVAPLVQADLSDFCKSDIFLPDGQLCSIFVLMTMSEIPKPNPETPPTAPARRGGSSGIRRATRLEKAERERRVVSLLNRGVSIPEIAAQQGLSLKRMRNVVREILAERMPQPPAEFLALQVSRLNEALLVSYSAMHTTAGGNELRGCRSCRQDRPRARPLSRVWRRSAAARRP